VGYRVTAVDTTQEGHLYVVVDFGNGWVEDFIFPDLTERDDVQGVLERVISEHELKGALYRYHGNRCDPNVRIGFAGPQGVRAAAMSLLGEQL
jgi:hypothetical protein